MLTTIWMWTQEWSDIPSRSEFTCAMCHHAATSGSALTASNSASSLRLPRIGARTFAASIASPGRRPRSPGPVGASARGLGLDALGAHARSLAVGCTKFFRLPATLISRP